MSLVLLARGCFNSLTTDHHTLPPSRLDARVHDFLCSNLDIQDLCSLLRVNRFVNGQVRAFMRRAYNIDRLLGEWFNSPEGFRHMQGRTGTIISGSQALQFIDRTRFDSEDGVPIDLDIYCDHFMSLVVSEYLESQEGYRFQPRANQEDDLRTALEIAAESYNELVPSPDYGGMKQIVGVFDFQRPFSERKIQLITANSAPLAVILGFHSSEHDFHYLNRGWVGLSVTF